MDNDTDLSGMTVEQAKEYVFAFMVTMKQTAAEAAKARSEAMEWRKRADLAASKARPDLTEQAIAEANRIDARAANLDAEAKSLASKIEAMKGGLRGIAVAERSVDPDALLASLGMLTGETLAPDSAKTEAEIRKLDAEAALAALKAKL